MLFALNLGNNYGHRSCFVALLVSAIKRLNNCTTVKVKVSINYKKLSCLTVEMRILYGCLYADLVLLDYVNNATSFLTF